MASIVVSICLKHANFMNLHLSSAYQTNETVYFLTFNYVNMTNSPESYLVGLVHSSQSYGKIQEQKLASTWAKWLLKLLSWKWIWVVQKIRWLAELLKWHDSSDWAAYHGLILCCLHEEVHVYLCLSQSLQLLEGLFMMLRRLMLVMLSYLFRGIWSF